MLNFNSILLFSENPQMLVTFYEKVFASKPVWSEGDFTAFKVGNGIITIGPHDMVQGTNKEPERVMFNLEADNVEKEFERIKKLDAIEIQPPYHPDESKEMTIATFSDPDGNYFQLISPMPL